MAAPLAPPALFTPRAVPLTRAFAWYETAMRIFKRAPFRWCVLGSITLGSELVLDRVPGIGVAAAMVIVPVVECGMLLGAAAVDRGAPLQIRYATAAFKAPVPALAAIVLSALLVSTVESLVAYALIGVNFLVDPPDDPRITLLALLEVAGVTMLASLPFVFVPLSALLEHTGFRRAFATSARAFSLNLAPLLLFGLLSLGLLLVGFLTYGVALVAVFPLVAAASYAAWRDIYGPTAP